MPKYRVAHRTDGDGIGPKLKGVELSLRLSKLSEIANDNYHAAEKKSREFMLHVQKTGEALLEAKRRLGHKGKWAKWKASSFDGSARTAYVYMQIARTWDDPKVLELRQSGVSVSINKILNRPQGKEKETRDQLSDVQRQISKRLKELTNAEIEVMYENSVDRWWDELVTNLRQDICAVMDELDRWGSLKQSRRSKTIKLESAISATTQYKR